MNQELEEHLELEPIGDNFRKMSMQDKYWYMISIKHETNIEFIQLIFWSVEEAVEYAERFQKDFLIHELEIIQTEEFKFNTGEVNNIFKKEMV